jgi:hypothetical protein
MGNDHTPCPGGHQLTASGRRVLINTTFETLHTPPFAREIKESSVRGGEVVQRPYHLHRERPLAGGQVVRGGRVSKVAARGVERSVNMRTEGFIARPLNRKHLWIGYIFTSRFVCFFK